MSLIQTINRAGKRIFIHFHDAGEFKEIEHPRGEGGLFVKKGTGGGGTSGVSSKTKPKAAAGAVVVNPVAKVLKEHGYEKQKGSNVYKHHTGHEVEVHAAAEGQKWLTGWTHGTTGNTGSGAGKLAKHLQSLPHGTMSAPKKEEPDLFEKKMVELSTYKPKPPPKALAEYPEMNFGGPGAAFLKPTATAAPHPLSKVHGALSGVMGFAPTEQDGYETTYLHNTQGKVVINNKPPASGKNKGQVKWSYYANPYETKPTATGNGIANGNLQQAIQKHAPKPASTPTPTTKSDVVKPSHAKYQNEEPTTWSGLTPGNYSPESAERFYNGSDPMAPIKSLIIGTGPNTKGQWKLWTKAEGTIATGEGQDELNAAFEKLHPRGEGGKFIAKPGSKEDKLAKQVETYANPLMEKGFKPYGEDDENIWFESSGVVNGVEVGKKLNYPSGNQSWKVTTNKGELFEGEGKGALLDKLKELEGGTITPSTGGATVVKHEPDFGLYTFEAPGNPVEQATSTQFSNDLYVVKSKESDKWEIVDIDGHSVAKGEGDTSLGNTSKKLGLPETPISIQGVEKPEGVLESDHVKLLMAGYKPAGTAPWGKDVEVYAKDDGTILLTKAKPETTGGATIFPPHPSGIENNEDLLTQMLEGKTPKMGEVPEGKSQFEIENQELFEPEETANAVTSVFSPFKAKGFNIIPDTDSGGVAGVLQNDPNLKMVFTYNSKTNGGFVSWQVEGDAAGSHSSSFTGTAGEFYNQLVEKHQQALAASGPSNPIGRPIHLTALTKIGEQKGSNPGGVYESTSGKKYYVKLPKTSLHASNELLAAELMGKAGGGTLKYHAINGEDGKINVGTEWEELQKNNVSQLTPAEKKQAQSDFAINAWLANWDAAGTGGDNTGILNGKPVTLDVGGALLFRAKGEPKGMAFGSVPNEWTTLRDPYKNADAAKLYGDMTPQEMKASAAKLNNITNQDIHDAISNHFDHSDPVAVELADKLIARRDKILQYAALIPATAPTQAPKPTPPPEPVYTQANPGPSGHSDPDGLRRKVATWNPPNKPTSAISAYKGSHYDPMNALMRFGALEEDDQSSEAKYIRQTTDWLDKASTQEELVVYRKVPNNVVQQWNKFAKVGRPLRDPGFQSTSTSKQFADNWNGPGITLRINMPKGTKAATVRNTDESDGEYEVLLQNGTVLRINSWQSGNYDVTVEQPHLKKG